MPIFGNHENFFNGLLIKMQALRCTLIYEILENAKVLFAKREKPKSQIMLSNFVPTFFFPFQ